MVEDMSVTDLGPGQVTCCPDTMPDLAPMNPSGLARSARGVGWTGLSAERPVVLAGTQALRGMGGAWEGEGRPSLSGQLLYADVIGSGDKLSIDDPGWADTVRLREIPPEAFAI